MESCKGNHFYRYSIRGDYYELLHKILTTLNSSERHLLWKRLKGYGGQQFALSSIILCAFRMTRDFCCFIATFQFSVGCMLITWSLTITSRWHDIKEKHQVFLSLQQKYLIPQKENSKNAKKWNNESNIFFQLSHEVITLSALNIMFLLLSFSREMY